MEEELPKKSTRGKGRGSSFFVLSRAKWDLLSRVEADNPLVLRLVYLCLLAGTGADQRLSKWSVKACEEYLGIGKPRARVAIEKLIEAKLISRTDASTALKPQYEFAQLTDQDEPIFLPVQMVTGFGSETPVLRRIRETGDCLALLMLIDLYGLVEQDKPFGLPLRVLRLVPKSSECRKIECGANTLWALSSDVGQLNASGDWVKAHATKGKSSSEIYADFWDRIGLLRQIGVINHELWLFESEDLDAEPMFPIDPKGGIFGENELDAQELAAAILDASFSIIGDRHYLHEKYADCFLVPLPSHHTCPAIRGVFRMRVDADTPARRLSYGRKVQAIMAATETYRTMTKNVLRGQNDVPINFSVNSKTLRRVENENGTFS